MIIKINGTEFKPSVMTIGVQDISAPNAGRDQSGYMHKMRLTSKVRISLEWAEPSKALTSQILTAVAPEYFYVQYTDPVTNSLVTKTMYVGDRSAPVRMWGSSSGRQWYSKVSFNLIER